MNIAEAGKIMDSESPSSRRRRIAAFTVLFVFTFMLLIVGIYTDHELIEIISPNTSEVKSLMNINEKFPSTTHRKLLNHQAKNPEDGEGELKQKDKEKMKKVEPNRIWSDKCSKSDIVISQGATEPLPNGIPTYTVEIMNVCVSGCDISAIHLSCGWFSSARLVNPRIFKRVHFDDCLVNDGKPLVNGRTLSFQYANTFRYPLSVTSVTC